MGAIWTSRARQRQPQVALGVDKGNPKAAKVSILVARGEARNYAAGGPAATATARVPIVAGAQGLAGTLSNSAYLTFPASTKTTGPEYSVLTVIRPSGGGVFFDCGNFRIQLINSFTQTRVQVDKAGVVQLIDAGLGVGTIGTWLTIAVTYNATTGAVTVSANNGVRASATSAQTLTDGTSALGNCSTVSNDVAMFAFAQTVWGPSQIADLLANPWQLFAPQRTARIYSFPTAGGAAALEGSLAASATVSAALTSAIRPAASVAASATVAAALSTSIRPAASVAASATVTAALTTAIRFASSVSASANVAGDISGAAALASTVSASAIVTGALTTAIRLNASLSGAATVSATLTDAAAAALEASITGRATVSASLTGGSSSIWTPASASSGTWTPASAAGGTWVAQ